MGIGHNAIYSILNDISEDSSSIWFLHKGNFKTSINLLSDDKAEALFKILEYVPPPVDNPNFGNWVQKARSAVGWTQDDLGSRIGTKKHQVCKIETKPELLSEEKRASVIPYLVEELKKLKLL